MQEAGAAQPSPLELGKRVEQYRAEIARIVGEGIEHPSVELKRMMSIARENLADRLDFIKLIQGLANSEGSDEKFIVIGADPQERKFYPVSNSAEFDAARLTQILAKYLEPQPRIEVFNNLQIEAGGSFVLVVFAREQPRPVIAACEGTSDKRTHFREGDIWIKKGTSLQLANRADLDMMYERHINREAENRARQRFKHFQEELGGHPALQPIIATPTRSLFVGSRKDLRDFSEATISSGDPGGLKMLIEMAHEVMVEGWDAHETNGPGLPDDFGAWIAEISEFFRDGFIPSLALSVELALQVIKYDAPVGWLVTVVETLFEAFERCRRLDRLRSGALGARPDVLPFGRPAFEIYIGLRTLATYAVQRKRFRFLAALLPKYVRYFTLDNQADFFVPLLFWPFSDSLGLLDMKGGRNRALWSERIQEAWPSYFGTAENFLSAASQLEFILEFNSYVFVTAKDPGVEKFKRALRKTAFDYVPDFWATRLDDTVPIAECFYDILAMGEIPSELTIEKAATDLLFQGKPPGDKLAFLGGFLAHLTSWQAEAMRQFNRFPFMFDWPGRLREIRNSYRAAQQPATGEAPKGHR
jgi:SAM-dependent methyltransferase